MKYILSLLIFALVICVTTSDANAQRGDFNGDGQVDGLDIPVFINALSDGTTDLEFDLNCDGDVNFLDIQPFIDVLDFDLGDVNRDGAVDFLDISPFQIALAFNFFQYDILADINGDCEVDNLDISPFIQILSGQ